MKKLSLALVLCCWGWNCSATACPPPDWFDVSKAYHVFLDHPTEANADTLIHKLPACTPDVEPDNEYWANLAPDAGIPGRNYQNYHELVALAEDGNIGAIRMMFRLEWLFDGDEGEVLGKDIGRISDIRPSEFLKAYAASRGDVRDLDGDLTSLPPTYIDDFSAQIKKLTQRYNALKLVKGVPKDAKEDCLNILRKQIKGLKEVLRESGPE